MGREFQVSSFIFQHFKYFTPIPNCLHCVKKVHCNSCLCSSINKVQFFFSNFFEDFLFAFGCLQCKYNMFRYILIIFFLVVLSASWTYTLCAIYWQNSKPLLFQLFLLLFPGSLYVGEETEKSILDT